MWKKNIHFILVEPQEPANIGSAARAMKNMGFKNLELVRPGDYRVEETRWLACNSYDVIEKAKVHETFQAAIQDKSIVVGTTRRVGKTRGLIVPIHDCARKIAELAEKNKIALVFGREDRGLTNDEVRQCGYLTTIPTHPEQPSLNLAHAVLIVGYELSQMESKANSDRLVDHAKIADLFERLNKTLRLFGYLPRGDRDLEDRIMKNIRHLMGRSGLTDWELNMIYGLCSRLERVIKSNTQSVEP